MSVPPPEPTLRPMRPQDWDGVRAIYLEGIATRNATFQTEAPTWDEWDRAHLPTPRLVAEREGRVVGWAVLSLVSGRCVYRGVAEVSVYVGAATRGAGVGRRLLERLISESEAAGIWTLQAGIFPENTASLAVHRSCGFREVGRRERLGKLGPTWRDVLLLERRSGIAGTD